MVLGPGRRLNALGRSMLRHEFLQAVRDPDVEEADARYSAEPGETVRDVSAAVVSMRAKQAADKDAPANGLHRVLKPEQVIRLQRVVLDLVLLR